MRLIVLLSTYLGDINFKTHLHKYKDKLVLFFFKAFLFIEFYRYIALAAATSKAGLSGSLKLKKQLTQN